MASLKHKLACQLKVSDKVILKDGKAKVIDTTQVVTKGVASKSGHITVLKVEGLEGSEKGKVFEFPAFADDKIEIVPKKTKVTWWAWLKSWFK